MIKKEQIENLCETTLKNHRSKYITIKERWLNLVERYDTKLRSGSISADTESHAPTGAAYALVENALPKILNRNPRYKYLPRQKDDVDTVELYDDFAQYQWDEAQAQAKIKQIAKWGLVTGMAGWKLGWKVEKMVQKKRGKEMFGRIITNPTAINWTDKLNIGKEAVVDEEAVISNWTLHPIRPFDLIWNIEAEEMRDVRVFGHKQRMTVREAEQMGYDLEGIKMAILKTREEYWKERIEDETRAVYERQEDLLNQEIEVYELYTRLLNEEGYYEYHIVHMATHGETELSADDVEVHTIGFQENPFDKKFIPMGVFRPTKRLSKMYGMGVIEPVRGIIDADEDTLNMALEALWTDISKPMEYVPQNLIKPDTIEYRPRTLVPVRALGQSVAVMPTPMLDIGKTTTMQQVLEKYKQNISGVTDFQTGAEQVSGDKTLGEVQIKTEESNQRLKMMLDEFERDVLQPIGKYTLWMNQQFLADKKKLVFRVISKKGLANEATIKFKDIEAIKDVVITTGSTMMSVQQEELGKWNLLLDKAMGYNQYAMMMAQAPTENKPGLMDTNVIWRELLEKGMLIKDVEKYIPSLKEQEQANVKGKVQDAQLAKQETESPRTARVLPNQNHEVHMRLHKAGVNAHRSQGDEQKAQMLEQHINDHAVQGGGRVPTYAGGGAEGEPVPPEQTEKEQANTINQMV